MLTTLAANDQLDGKDGVGNAVASGSTVSTDRGGSAAGAGAADGDGGDASGAGGEGGEGTGGDTGLDSPAFEVQVG